MKLNEYNTLQEFIEEYDGKTYKNHQSFIGIEFTYHDVYYRMCREPFPPEDFPILPDGRKGRYRVVVVHWKNGWLSDFDYELIGWYATLDDVLNNCKIQGRPFSEVIMDDATKIVSKD